MKVSTKRLHDERIILVDKKSIAVAFTKSDAKFIAKCIRKYKKKNRDK